MSATNGSEKIVTAIENEDHALEESEPCSKKRKMVNESYRLNRVAKKVVDDSNELLALTDFEGRIDKSYVSVSYEESGKISASVKCIICKRKTNISLNSTKYSACVSNFKRHLSTTHFKKPTNEKPAHQPTMDSFLVKPDGLEEFSNDHLSTDLTLENEGE